MAGAQHSDPAEPAQQPTRQKRHQRGALVTLLGTGPHQAPPHDWVSAVTRDQPEPGAGAAGAAASAVHQAVIDQLAHRAQAAADRAEDIEHRLSDLEHGRPERSAVDHASATLVAAFNIEPDRAFESLLWVAHEAGLPLRVAAEQFLAHAHRLPPTTATTAGQRRDDLTALLAALAGHEAHPARHNPRTGTATAPAAANRDLAVLRPRRHAS